METEQSNTLIDKIKIFDLDIQKFAHNAKVLKEQIAERIEALPEYAAVESLKEQLKTAQEALKQAKLRAPGLNDLVQKLADEKDAKKTAELNMSDFLLGYFAETRERQIELDDGDAREVILKGKLGKATNFQTNLFAGGGDQ